MLSCVLPRLLLDKEDYYCSVIHSRLRPFWRRTSSYRRIVTTCERRDMTMCKQVMTICRQVMTGSKPVTTNCCWRRKHNKKSHGLLSTACDGTPARREKNYLFWARDRLAHLYILLLGDFRIFFGQPACTFIAAATRVSVWQVVFFKSVFSRVTSRSSSIIHSL